MTENGSRKAELRSRWRSALEDGTLASLRSEGRLVALYAFLHADWSTCRIRLSMRKAAKRMGVQPTTVRRGVGQLVAVGVLKKIGASADEKATIYEVDGRARAVSTPDTSGARNRTHSVSTPDTSGARTGHEPCARRTRVVRSARTRCAHSSVSSSGIPVNTSGNTSLASPTAGAGPAVARPEDEKAAR